MMSLDLEGARRVAEDIDLTGCVGLHPDGRVGLSSVAQQRAENEAWRGTHARPTSGAIKDMPSGISIRAIKPKAMITP